MKMRIQGTVICGHQVASGQGGDLRYPIGTLGLQLPIFKSLGLDVDDFFAGTINVDISPARFQLTEVPVRLDEVEWTEHHPPEDFYFFPCHVVLGETKQNGMIYMPSPQTKAEHFQKDSVLEVLAPWISGLSYGDSIELELTAGGIALFN